MTMLRLKKIWQSTNLSYLLIFVSLVEGVHVDTVVPWSCMVIITDIY